MNACAFDAYTYLAPAWVGIVLAVIGVPLPLEPDSRAKEVSSEELLVWDDLRFRFPFSLVSR